jgi:hypothetical protein
MENTSECAGLTTERTISVILGVLHPNLSYISIGDVHGLMTIGKDHGRLGESG